MHFGISKGCNLRAASVEQLFLLVPGCLQTKIQIVNAGLFVIFQGQCPSRSIYIWLLKNNQTIWYGQVVIAHATKLW